MKQRIRKVHILCTNNNKKLLSHKHILTMRVESVRDWALLLHPFSTSPSPTVFSNIPRVFLLNKLFQRRTSNAYYLLTNMSQRCILHSIFMSNFLTKFYIHTYITPKTFLSKLIDNLTKRICQFKNLIHKKNLSFPSIIKRQTTKFRSSQNWIHPCYYETVENVLKLFLEL